MEIIDNLLGGNFLGGNKKENWLRFEKDPWPSPPTIM